MNTQPIRRDGGAWRTLREAVGGVVRSPFGCVALGIAFLGVAGVMREHSQSAKADAERASWSRNVEQDLRDSLRDESSVRGVRLAASEASRRRAREKALREAVGAALREALESTAQRQAFSPNAE